MPFRTSLARNAAWLFLGTCLAACGEAPAGPVTAPATAATEAPAPTPTDPGTDSPPAAPPAAVTPACDVDVPRTAPLEVAVLPDAGAAPFVAVLSHATRTIRVMVYEMGTGPILDTLEAKAKAGVDVRVILDLAQESVNQKYKDRLEAAGAKVIWSDPQFTFMHAKVMVVDEEDAMVSTGNYAAFRMEMERNFAARDTDPADVDVLVKLFDADFARTSPDLSCTRLVVSPVNSRQRILDLIASAKTELVVESMQLADDDVRKALVARKEAGVGVRVLLADPGWIDANTSAASYLASHGIEARQMKAPAVHVKAITVDGARSYIGSENLSYTSLSKNREVGVIVREAANVTSIHTTFETDWATATAF